MSTTDIIRQLEERRGSRLLAYVTGDRQPFAAQIGADAVRPMYDHLLAMGKQERIDLFIYSLGGDVSVPWRIVSMLREFCDEFAVLVPYKAYSAATLLSLGADHIVMGKKAELGPIDPTLTRSPGDAQQQAVSVEDVNSFVSFVRDRANINDQAALAKMFAILADQLSPLTLGSINRNNSHIRLVARKLLTSRKETLDEAKLSAIIDMMTEKMYSHGHGIGRKEAEEIGLPVRRAPDDVEALMWELLLAYERRLCLDEPFDPNAKLEQEEEVTEDIVVAVVESAGCVHEYGQRVKFRKQRAVPPSPAITVNVQLALPPGLDPANLPADVQQWLQNAISAAATGIEAQVRQELVRQSPVVRIEQVPFLGRWTKSCQGSS